MELDFSKRDSFKRAIAQSIQIMVHLLKLAKDTFPDHAKARENVMTKAFKYDGKSETTDGQHT